MPSFYRFSGPFRSFFYIFPLRIVRVMHCTSSQLLSTSDCSCTVVLRHMISENDVHHHVTVVSRQIPSKVPCEF
ncbi:hypothetical protein MKW92_041936 [Papaver armeniacum]|nr:hypothetical protein MKW92_041936 [Papaver armeniacum]